MNKDLKKGSGVKSEISPADGKPPVVRSAYFVSVKGRGDIFVVAENIADACDKLDAASVHLLRSTRKNTKTF